MKQLRERLENMPSLSLQDQLRLAESIGDLPRAERIVRAARAKNPAQPALKLYLADLLSRQLAYDESERLYRSLMRELPGSVEPYLALSAMARLRGRHEQGWKILEQGVTANLSSRNTANLLALARRYQEWKNPREAETILRKTVNVAINPADVTVPLAGLLAATGRTAESRRLLEEILQKENNTYAAKRQLAELIAEHPTGKTDIDRAGRLIAEIVQAGQSVPNDFFILGRLLEQEQDWANATAAYVRVLTATPERPDVSYRLAQVYGRLGQKPYQQTMMERYTRLRGEMAERSNRAVARTSSPRSAAAHFAEAQFAEKTKDYRVATIAYDLAAKLAPTDTRIRTARVRYYRFLDWPLPESGKR